jgi:ubiquinone/menaquinone biosynthesis C-methylase UbiE
MSRFYRWISPFYEWSERAGARHLLGMEADAAWADVVARLGPLRGSRLLEVSPGPGNYQPFLRTALGPEGQLVALDLSYPMLRQCGRQHAKEGAVLVHANGEYLPFMDACFDGLFHFGGINLFSRPSQALSEFVRVVKPGGLVAYGDEGFASDYPQTWRRTMLTRMNPGYLKPRPAPPAGITEVLEQSVCGGLGYLVTARKKKDPTLAQDPLGS